ncbi:MAG TPA: hypothetical protein VFR21_15640 [Bradyrhizobium sp.]|nr:hypothetical protein [Bradyrhizobium sp.]
MSGNEERQTTWPREACVPKLLAADHSRTVTISNLIHPFLSLDDVKTFNKHGLLKRLVLETETLVTQRRWRFKSLGRSCFSAGQVARLEPACSEV